MTLGQRLLEARQAAGLSQRELCGDRITRNQLSQLEHDRVRPSLETLRYLADRLGRPLSYFLDGGSPNLRTLDRVRACWDDPAAALRALDAYSPESTALDDLAALLEAAVCLRASDLAAEQGREPYAAALVRRGREALERTAFSFEALEQAAALRRAELAKEPDFLPAARAWTRDRDLTLLARLYLARDLPEPALALAEDLDDPALRGRALCRLGRYEEAARLLRRAEAADPARAPALWPLLEEACRESGDYRGAYEYACKRAASR